MRGVRWSARHRADDKIVAGLAARADDAGPVVVAGAGLVEGDRRALPGHARR